MPVNVISITAYCCWFFITTEKLLKRFFHILYSYINNYTSLFSKNNGITNKQNEKQNKTKQNKTKKLKTSRFATNVSVREKTNEQLTT